MKRFFTKLFGSGPERRKAVLADIADDLGIDPAFVTIQGSVLEAHWIGARLELDYPGGRPRTCRLTHDELGGSFELSYDEDRRKESASSPDDTREKVRLGDGAFCEDRRAFERLPEGIRARVAAELRKSQARVVQVHPEELNVEFWSNDDAPVSAGQIVRALSFAMEILKARGLEATKPIRKASQSPREAAKAFAARVPGSKYADLGGTGVRATWAEVVFVHEGKEARLVFRRFDEHVCNVWLEVQAPAKHGAFGVMSDAENADAADGVLFLSKRCYVSDENARAEAARFMSLPDDDRARAIAITESFVALVLQDEVLKLSLGDLASFLEHVERAPSAESPPFPLSLVGDLAQIVDALPDLPRDVATLAESRTCRFCDAHYLFSPANPRCTRCGARPQAGADR